MIRKKDVCPRCGVDSEVLYDVDKCTYEDKDGNRLVYPGQAIYWKCSKCKMEWDINEDFECVVCGKEVPGRYLYCSTDCEKVVEGET